MELRRLGMTELKVSRLSFGASSLGGVFGPVDEKEAVRAVHCALSLGMNYIDVAPAYGGTVAEEVLGRALKGTGRARYFLSTKVGKYTDPDRYGRDEFDYSAGRIRRSLDESSARLGSEYFDIVHLHDIEYLGGRHRDWALSEGLETLRLLQEEGRVGYVGCGFYPVELWEEVLLRFPIDVGLVHNHYTLNDTRLLDLLPLAEKKGVGLINASPFASGLLTGGEAPDWHPASLVERRHFRAAAEFCRKQGTEIARLAIQFSSSNSAIPTTMFSAPTVEQVERNAAWMEEPLDASLLDRVRRILAPVRDKDWDYDQGLVSGSAGD